MFNIGENKKAFIDISFAGKDLIKGGFVNPLAPEWYVKTVEAFCNNNNIPFEGRSILYDA